MTASDEDAFLNPPSAPLQTAERPSRAALFCRAGAAVAALTAFVLLLDLQFSLFSRYAYMTFDLGIFAQGTWLLSQGQSPFVTSRGVPLFGDHFSAVLLLLAPLYRLFPTPKTLLAAQTAALCLGALPVYALANRRLNSEIWGLAFALLYLLYPAHEWSVTYEFHPDPFATPLLLAAFWGAEAKRWPVYALSLLGVALVKESAGVALFGVGVWVFFVDRKRGAWTLAFAVLSFVGANLVVRSFNGGRPSPYFVLYSEFGGSPLGIVETFFTQPLLFFRTVVHPGNLFYEGLLLAPLAFLPLLAPEVLLCCIPLLLINLLSSRPGMHSIEEYYNALITPFLFLGAIVGVARSEKWGWWTRWIVRLNLPLWALAGATLSPLAQDRLTLYSVRVDANAVRECSTALSLIPPNASVSAGMALGPHLAHRRALYTFPNPFFPAAYGGTAQVQREIESVNTAVPPSDLNARLQNPEILQKAEYVVLAPKSSPFPMTDTNVHKVATALLASGNYETEWVGHYVLLLKRTHGAKAALKALSQQANKPVRTSPEIEAAYWHWLAAQYPPPKESIP